MKINMLVHLKKIYLLVFAITFLTAKSQAQHCPFDGTSIIMLKIKGDKKEITNIVLIEKKTQKSDTCRFTEGLIRIDFQPIDSLYAQNSWVEEREDRPKMLSKKGDYCVTLNMAQVDCMVAKGNEYTHQKRYFMLSYRNIKTGKTIEIDVSNEKIYSLCTSYGSWDRIKAISIKY